MRISNIPKLKDRSTETVGEYLFNHLFYGSLLGYDLYMFLPLIVPIFIYERSTKELVLCMLITSIVGIVCTISARRTGIGVLLDILAGAGLYVAITLGMVYTPQMIKYIFLIGIVITLLGVSVISFRGIKNRTRIKYIIKSRLYRDILLLRRNSAVALGLILIFVPISMAFTDTDKIANVYIKNNGYPKVYAEDDYKVTRVYGEQYRLAENIDIIKDIRYQDTWKTLTFEQRCLVITALNYCELAYLGIPYKVDVYFVDNLENEILGCYSHEEKAISYNSNRLMTLTNEETIKLVLHESHHVYSHSVCDILEKLSPEERALLCFNNENVNGVAWAMNFNSYISGRYGGFWDYYTQPVELDANIYAEENIQIYFQEIDALLVNQ